MSTTSLTAKYRPQTFADVAGQESVKAILSRAAAEDKVAPAYLFSGTRGVGKTTLARIFAKALNCAQAPTAEPCNQCDSCKQVTAGVAVDVVEIDGASNRGIDDARRLREDIGYAPLEGRYKVFIIDEAHMLTKEAFNALLKTLEEPPPRVTFILATTEAHKFPATILSRCQHYGFKTLSAPELVAHLEKIMQMEGLAYEAGALNIIAKRGAGSVRDSMSLLGQALALGQGELKEDAVRGFLGLAGQEVFFQLVEAVHGRDLVGVGRILRQLMEDGVDLGFFLRELAQSFRNMFLLRQAGDAALELVELSGEEAVQWKAWADKLSAPFIHACWQMILEGQRRVMMSPEPGLALELLLLNLASLPDLLGLDGLAGMPGGQSGSGQASGSGSASSQGSGVSGGSAPAGGHGMSGQSASGQPQTGAPQASQPQASQSQASAPQASQPQNGFNASAPTHDQAAPGHDHISSDPAPDQRDPNQPDRDQRAPDQGAPDQRTPAENSGNAMIVDQPLPSELSQEPAPRPTVVRDSELAPPDGPRSVEGFLDWLTALNGKVGGKVPLFKNIELDLQGDRLVARCRNKFGYDQLLDPERRKLAGQLIKEYFGPATYLVIELDEAPRPKGREELMDEARENPAVNRVVEAFGARVVDARPRARA